MTIIAFNEFTDREKLAERLAEDIAFQLRREIDREGRAAFAVSGGSTPELLFDTLSRTPLDWERMLVTLVDERGVPPDHDRSNERLARERLLQNYAAPAQFISIRDNDEMEQLPDRFTAVVLGMGLDGHTASWFPDGDTLETVVKPDCSRKVMTLTAPTAGEIRHTLTMPAIAGARFLALHIEGAEKRNALVDAIEDGEADEMPIRHVIRNDDTQMHVYWAE